MDLEKELQQRACRNASDFRGNPPGTVAITGIGKNEDFTALCWEVIAEQSEDRQKKSMELPIREFEPESPRLRYVTLLPKRDFQLV